MASDEVGLAVLGSGPGPRAAPHHRSPDHVELLACTIRERLSADAVVIAHRCPDGTLAPAGVTGLGDPSVTALLAALSGSDASADDLDPAEAGALGGDDLLKALCVPLAVDGERVGVLCVHPRRGE